MQEFKLKYVSAQTFKLCCRFEKDIQEKLRQRCDSKMTEELTLVKMFKYFDQENKGAVNCEQFVRVLEKTGMYYPLPTLKKLFNEYDTNHNGQLDYRELAYVLSGNATVLHQKPIQHQDLPSR